MSRTTKSPLAVARAALDLARRALPPYSHPNSPKTYTQHQLLALLILKQFLRLDYRGIVAYTADWSDLRDTLGLRRVPHHTALEKAEKRLLKKLPSPRSSTPRLPRPPTAG
jgi:hypothetical protein